MTAIPARAVWSPPAPWSSPLILLAAWTVIAALLVLLCLDDIKALEALGPDDELRLVQVRDFVEGQAFRDVTQYRLAPPDGAPMHWSRLVDLPIASATSLLEPVMGKALAERLAMTMVPLSLLLVLMAIMLASFERLGFGRLSVVGAVGAILHPFSLQQFLPTRIDHHGWQIVCGAAALCLLVSGRPLRSGLGLGLVTAFWLHVSIEGLPYAAALGAIIAVRQVVDRRQARRLVGYLSALSVASLCLFLLTQPLARWTQSWCDAVMPPHLAAFAAAACVVSLVSVRGERWWRAVVVGLAGLASAASFALVGPQCLGSPFADLDPLVRDLWYVNVREGMPIWRFGAADTATFVLTTGLGLLGMSLAVRRETERRLLWASLTVFALGAALIGLLVARAGGLATVCAAPGLLYLGKAAWPVARARKTDVSRAVATASLVIVLTPLLSWAVLQTVFDGVSNVEGDAATALSEPVEEGPCVDRDVLATLSALPPTTMLAPLDVTPTLLVGTPHTFLASSHHRNQAFMREVMTLFLAAPSEAREGIERFGITHVVLCPEAGELSNYRRRAPDGLASLLTSDRVPDWLEAVPSGGSLSLWRVVPSR